MNPDLPENNDLEWRVTALLLGELPPEEAAKLEVEMAQNPELAALHARLKGTIELVGEVAALPTQFTSERAPKLNPERRNRLVAQFTTTRLPQKKTRSLDVQWLSSLALAALLMGLLTLPLLFLTTATTAKRKSRTYSDESALSSRYARTESFERDDSLGQVKAQVEAPEQEFLARRASLPTVNAPAGPAAGQTFDSPSGLETAAAGKSEQKKVTELNQVAQQVIESESRFFKEADKSDAQDSEVGRRLLRGSVVNAPSVPAQLSASSSTAADAPLPALPQPARAEKPLVELNKEVASSERRKANEAVLGGNGVRYRTYSADGASRQKLAERSDDFFASSNARSVTDPNGVVAGNQLARSGPANGLSFQTPLSASVDTAAGLPLTVEPLASPTAGEELAELGKGIAPSEGVQASVADGVALRDNRAFMVDRGSLADEVAKQKLDDRDDRFFESSDSKTPAKEPALGYAFSTITNGSVLGDQPAKTETWAFQDGEKLGRSNNEMDLALNHSSRFGGFGGGAGGIAGRKAQVEVVGGAVGGGALRGLEEKSSDVSAVPQLREKLVLKDSEPAAPAQLPARPAPVPQPEVITTENAFSTFSLNVSDVSFKLAAASLQNGALPEPAAIRSEEFLNAFNYHDPEPAPGTPLAFTWERARWSFAQNRDLLRLSVKTASSGRASGQPLNLVLLLDNSGSMERADRVQIVNSSLRVLAAKLQPQDKFSLITFARTPRVWLDGLNGDQALKSIEEAGEFSPEGGTNLEEALNQAYRTARAHFLANGNNRIVLLTDGAANLGNTDAEVLKATAVQNRQQGIALDCFGIGWEGYNDDLLENLSRNADGRYGFLNDVDQAAPEFATQLAGALQVFASDVKVQVQFNPERVKAYRQIGYAKHQLTKEQFRDNTVDAAEIGAAESGTAAYIIEVDPAGQGPLGTTRVRFRDVQNNTYQEQEWVMPYTGAVPSLDQASPTLRLAGVAVGLSEWLANSPYAGDTNPDSLLHLVQGVPEVFNGDPRPQNLEWMLRQVKSISGQ